MMHKILSLFVLFPYVTFSQESILIKKTEEQITIDGVLSEKVWGNLDGATDFNEQFPNDSLKAEEQSIVFLVYDDNHIYLAARCFDKNGVYINQTLKRDNLSAFLLSDAFSFHLDPIGEMTSGYLFGVNSAGAQVEATISTDGNQTNVNSNWDTKWYSAVSQLENQWIVEMAIPFKSIRFDSEIEEWKINFVRQHGEVNTVSSWAKVPRNFSSSTLIFNQNLTWDKTQEPTKRNIAIIPYTLGRLNNDFTQNAPGETDFDVGGDAKISISSLNLDLTVNPDFSQVDVDRQVLNLTRFSLFFPERRTFFLENSDLFANFGSFEVRPFFSRSIGLDQGRIIPIKYGARLSGNVTNSLRLGIMNLQTKDELNAEGGNHLAAAFQQQIFGRTLLKGLFTNKESYSNGEHISQNYNRTLGGELIQLSQNGQLSTQIKFHKSYQNEFETKNTYLFSGLFFSNRNVFTGARFTSIGENFLPASGFTPRLFNYDPQQDSLIRIGYFRNNAWFQYTFYTEDSNHPIVSHGPNLWTLAYFNHDGKFNDFTQNISYHITFRRFNRLNLRTRINATQLFFPTSFTRNREALPSGRYNYTFGGVSYNSSRQDKFYYDLEIRYGKFYNGTNLSLRLGGTLRVQPWGNFGVNYNFSKLDFPDPYGSNRLHLISPTAEISFSNKMFWTTFLQFNTQSENFNINSRFQWRYSPMSDLFIVYSDNYTTTDFSKKNRALVIKLTYWFNS